MGDLSWKKNINHNWSNFFILEKVFRPERYKQSLWCPYCLVLGTPWTVWPPWSIMAAGASSGKNLLVQNHHYQIQFLSKVQYLKFFTNGFLKNQYDCGLRTLDIREWLGLSVITSNVRLEAQDINSQVEFSVLLQKDLSGIHLFNT